MPDACVVKSASIAASRVPIPAILIGRMPITNARGKYASVTDKGTSVPKAMTIK